MNETKLKKLQWMMCISGFLDLFGVAMIFPLLVHRAKELGATPSQVGLFSSIYGSLQFISSPLMGQLSDHLGRRKVLLIALIGTSISYALMGAAESIFFLSLARIPSGIFKHSQSLSKAYLADISLPADRAGVFGKFNTMSSIGFIVGPTLAGYIAMSDAGFAYVGYLSAALFVLNAIFNLYGIGYVLGEDPPEIVKVDKLSEKGYDLLSAFNAFRDVHKIEWNAVWDVFIVRFLMSFSLILYRSNFTSILTYKFTTNQLSNGYVQTFNGIVSMVTGCFIDRITPRFTSTAIMNNVFGVILVVSLVLLSVVPMFWLYIVAIIPLCVSSSILRVINTTEIANRGGEETRGLVMGLSNTLVSLARAISPIIAGYALEINYMLPGLCAAFLALMGTLLLFYSEAANKRKSSKKVE